ncbi:MAG TPA: hypothetical protein VFZ59_05990, partial [Verrucomicrobiae bacterium]|nr:hypothetical protein [Verrucomicrobiae bacterium]
MRVKIRAPQILIVTVGHAQPAQWPAGIGFAKKIPSIVVFVKSRSAVVRSAVFWPNCHPKSGCVYDLNVGEVPSAPSSLFLNPRHP